MYLSDYLWLIFSLLYHENEDESTHGVYNTFCSKLSPKHVDKTDRDLDHLILDRDFL